MRLSNIELLRIIAMFMVLCIHTILAIGYPEVLNISSIEYFAIGLFKAFAFVAVNVFIMISGWFGINYTNRGLFRLLLQIIFFTLVSYFLSVALSIQPFSLKGVLSEGLMLGARNYWFVQCYILLYVLSPILNFFCENATRKQFKDVLVVYFVAQCLFSWLLPTLSSEFNNGLSSLSFIGLYLVARFIRIYQPEFALFSPKTDFMIYFILSTFLAIVAYISHGGTFLKIGFFSYSSPFVIVASLYLLLAFSKIKFSNRFVNWVASSSFAVYLLHENISLVKSYRDYINEVYRSDINLSKWGGVIALMIIVYLISIALDKLRQLLIKLFSINNGNVIK